MNVHHVGPATLMLFFFAAWCTCANAGPAVAVKEFADPDPQSVYGWGLSELVENDLAQLANDTPAWKPCEMAVGEWRRRDEILKELELQQSPRFDPATRAKPGQLIQPTVFIEGSVSNTAGQVSWNIQARDAATGRVIGSDSGSISENHFYDVTEGIAQRLASILCDPPKPKRPTPPPEGVYAGTVSIDTQGENLHFSGTGHIELKESHPGSGSYTATQGELELSYTVDDCPDYQGRVRLHGEMQLDAPGDGQHMLVLVADPFELSCRGLSLPVASEGMMHICEAGNGGGKDTQLHGTVHCGGTTVSWHLDRH